MNPQARTAELAVLEGLECLTIMDHRRDVIRRLHPIAAFLWTRADGQVGVDDLTAQAVQEFGLEGAETLVWAAFDRLADADLLLERIAPPGALHCVGNRELVETMPGHGNATDGFRASPGQGCSDRANPFKNDDGDRRKMDFEMGFVPSAVNPQNQEQASKTAQEQASKLAQEQASKAAQEQASKRAQEQASKTAQEQAGKRAQEQASKAAQEQASKRAQEQASKAAQEQASKRA